MAMAAPMQAFPSSTNSTGVWYISWISLWSTWFLTQEVITSQSEHQAVMLRPMRGQLWDCQWYLCVPDEAGAAAHDPHDAPLPQHLRPHHPRQVGDHAPAHGPRDLAQADVALEQRMLFTLRPSLATLKIFSSSVFVLFLIPRHWRFGGELDKL